MQGKIIILGKPNVGKSSLFNRLIKDKVAITSEIEGTTRDINIRPLPLGDAENPLNIELCDTAGLMKKADGIFKNVKKMIFDFINKNDLILYVISAESGIMDDDLRTFRALDSAILVVNKVDVEKNERWEYNAFGAGKIFYVSSLHNRGIKQLRDFLGNLFWGNHSHGVLPLASSMDSQVLFPSKGQNAVQSTTAIPSVVDSANLSNSQNLNKNNPCEAPENSPASWCKKSESKGAVVPPADFLLEAEKRGSPPKSEKAAAFWRVGGAGRGVQPFLRERNSNENAESALNSTESQNLQSGLQETSHSLVLPRSPALARNDSVINIGIIGRVNVGKSSILNALLGKERSLVSEIEGTTIDPVSDEITHNGQILRFVDTAGIRRASKIEGIEKFALSRTKRILEQSNIVLLVLDASQDFVELDEKISGLSQKYNLGVIILLNKWDIKCADFRALQATIKRKFAYLSYAPVLTISALKMRHIDEIKDAILRVWENFNRRIPTAQLNEHIKIATTRHPLPSERGKIVKIYYASQVDCAPPQIVLVMNRPRALHFSYKRYLVNYFRSNFDFSGVPLVILSKGRGKDEVAE